MLIPPEGPGGPIHPPPTPFRKDSIFNFGQIQIYGAKIQMYGDKIQIYSAKIQICGAKIQIFDPQFKYVNFCTTKNLPLCTRKTPRADGLTPTHPPIVVIKKLKRPPLEQGVGILIPIQKKKLGVIKSVRTRTNVTM